MENQEMTVADVLTLGKGLGSGNPNTDPAAATRGYNAFVRLLPIMPEFVKEGFKNKTLQYENVAYYSTEGFTNTAAGVATLFPTGGKIEKGISNVSEAKLEDQKPAVIVAIYLEYSAGATAAAFTRAAIPAGMNGDVKIRVDEKDILNVGLHSFRQVEGTSNVYCYEIDGKLIPDKKKIEANVTIISGGSTAGGSGNFFKMTLEGLGVRSK
jgi:hypothetical protein